MAKITIEGKKVDVDDSFFDLTPDEQEIEIAHIAEQIGANQMSGGDGVESKTKAENFEEGVKKENTDLLGIPSNIAGEVIGGTTGAIAGPMVGNAIDTAATMGAKVINPNAAKIAGAPVSNSPAAVRRWLATQTSNPYAGGKTQGEAYLKSEIAAGKPIQSRGSKAPMRRGNLSISNQPPEETFAQKRASNILNAEKLGKPGIGRRVLGMGIVGGELGNLKEEYEHGNYGRAALSGLGAFGGAASQSSIKPLRTIGNILSVGVPAAQYFTSEKQEKADGGAVQHFARGKEVLNLVGKAVSAKAPLAAQKNAPLWLKHGYDPVKIGNQYPDVIPPVLAKDPKTGKEFFQKANSPEALAVQKARNAAQKQIDAGDYQPHFDVDKRYYVDPSHYPTAGKTLTDVVPKKADTIAKYTELANDPEALARLRGAFEKAKDRPAAKDWYAMGQLEDAFIKELGPEEGRRQFKARFADAMAATTGGADPNSNLMMAAFTNYQKALGHAIPEKAADLPFPVGGRFVSGNMEQANKLAQLGQIPVTNPKRHNFSANFLGHRDVSTLDEQMSQLWDPKMMSPPPNAYGIYEQALAKEAERAGVNPVNFQDIAWAGAKDYPGKAMMTEINEMLARTSKMTGQSQEDVLKGFIRSDKPMYGIGALGLGEAASQDDAIQKHALGGVIHKTAKKKFEVGGSISDRANEQLREEYNNGEPSTMPFSFFGGSQFPQNPNIPMGAGMPPQDVAFGHVGHNIHSKHGRFNLGATGISANTPEGRINKLAGVDVGYEHPSGFFAKINKPTGGMMSPRFDVGYHTSFADGGEVQHFQKGGIPKEVVKAYKLFRTDPKVPNSLYPLFVNANEQVPLNKWVDATAGTLTDAGKVKSKIGDLAYRPGWHAGEMPVATHIGGKSDPTLKAPDYRPGNQVWAEVEMPNDVDWQTIANQRAQLNKAGKPISRTAHITDQLPEGGHYRYKTNPNMTGDWLIGGSMKVNKVLTDDEVKAINEAMGVSDLPRIEGKSTGGKIASGLTSLGKNIIPLAEHEAYKAKFTPGFYHGSPSPDIKSFDPTKSPRDPMYVTPKASFVTQDPKFAESFLSMGNNGRYKSGATMYPVSVNLGKHWHPDTPEGQQVIQDFIEKNPKRANLKFGLNRGAWTAVENSDFLTHLKNTGHDTFHVVEGGSNVGVLKPENIRGKFAEYNPEEAASPEIMKATGGEIISGLASLGKKLLPFAKKEAPGINALHPNVLKAIDRGDIHPTHGPYFNDMYNTPGSPTKEIGNGLDEKQFNYMQRVKNEPQVRFNFYQANPPRPEELENFYLANPSFRPE